MTAHLRNNLFVGLLVVSLLGAAACSGLKTQELAATADEAVTRVTRGLADGHPEVAWRALPTSYQKDITELVHDAAAGVDPELWNRSFSVLQKLSTLLSDKRDLFLEHPMFAQGMADKDDVEEGWEAAAEAFEIVVKSDLADLEQVKNLDIGEFLADTGADLMEQMAEASALAPDDPWNKQMKTLRATKASVLSSTDDTATVRIKRPGQPPSEDEYVRVEGKWIPKIMADSWSETIAGVKQQLAEVSGQENPEDKQKALMMLSMVEGVLDSMLAADSPEQFNAAVGAAMGMAMSAVMAQTGDGGMSLSTDSPIAMPQAMRTLTSAPIAAFPPALQESRDSLPRVAIAEDGAIPVAQAKRFVGRTMWVTSHSGLNSKCKLTGIENGLLAFERNFAGGNISFELNSREIESLRVIDR